MIYGYARSSIQDLNLDNQRERLNKYGCNVVIEDFEINSLDLQPSFNSLVSQLKKGDSLVVTSFTRLNQTTKKFVLFLCTLHTKGIRFVSLDEQFDTSTQDGVLILLAFSRLVDMDKSVIVERTSFGIRRSRFYRSKSQETIVGRPRKSRDTMQNAIKEYSAGQPLKAVCKKYKISQSTLYKYMKRINEKKARESITKGEKNETPNIF